MAIKGGSGWANPAAGAKWWIRPGITLGLEKACRRFAAGQLAATFATEFAHMNQLHVHHIIAFSRGLASWR